VVDDTRAGRHRNAARYNPVAELSTIVKSAGETSVKASAVLAASGGLVAAFALPAQAAPAPARVSTAAGASAAAAPSAEKSTTTVTPAAAALAPAVVAPETAAPVAVERVGVVGVKAVAKPKPKTVAAVVSAALQNRGAGTSQVSRSTTRYSNPVQSSSQIVNIARTLLGIPYVYGGSSPSGFDCSGFTMYVFGKAGISIPRTASAQQDAATPVSDPKPGDLVFFGSPAWHVGIYTGNGMMIDSPRDGKSTSERAIFSGVSGYGRF
jgi:peptidoglycan DL-endopeptidase CwlO